MTKSRKTAAGPASAAGEGQAMSAPSPKPGHGLRGLLREVGIVVLGIVIAIGLQQVVEQVHWAQEVRSARASLGREMAHTNRNLAFRVAAEACVDHRLDALEGVIEKVAMHAPVPHLPPIGDDIGNALNDNTWEAHRASQTLTHFDDGELSLYGIYYLQLRNLTQWMGNESVTWSVLGVLHGDPARLGPADIAALRVAIQQARFDNSLIAGIASDELGYARRLHVATPAADPARLKATCGPLWNDGGV